MTIAVRLTFHLKLINTLKYYLSYESRSVSTVVSEAADENTEECKRSHNKDEPFPSLNCRFKYPEFLPDPNPFHRNKVREKLERRDMLSRRSIIEIPEFYVGSILAVSYSDQHAPGKQNRFLGICIKRSGCGLRSRFILRNVIDETAVEILYYLYDPTIQKFEVIRLEKRLDDELLYLRDAPLKYSTFASNMEVKTHVEGTEVPVNEIKIPLNPTPWLQRWERMNMKGILDCKKMVNVKRQILAESEIHKKPWEKYDLMKIYRETIPIEEQREIFAEVYSKLDEYERNHLKKKRVKGILKSKSI